MEIPTDILVGAECQASNAKQAVGPRPGDFGRAAQLAPIVGERLDVGDLVCRMCLPEPLEPRRPRRCIDGGSGNDGHERIDGVAHGGADRTGRTVDLLKGRRKPLK